MIKLINSGVYLVNGEPVAEQYALDLPPKKLARKNTMAYSILNDHAIANKDGRLSIKFDSLVSHDITYVGIIQTARASGLSRFPVPYALTNCHNSLCAVGGTINEDDHVFGLCAAKKYGGIYVPANLSVIHMYAREALSECGGMILGSDSHTRYGALGTMGIGEGGPEIVKQLLSNTYDIDEPEVVLVYVTGEPGHGIGPHDIALSLIKATFKNGFVKNKILEFAGPGISSLPIDFRNAIDVMTTETTCLSSIWQTDDEVMRYYKLHKRPECFKKLEPKNAAYYESMIALDLSKAQCMIALPFHPSNAFGINELNDNLEDILHNIDKDISQASSASCKLSDKIIGKSLQADQGIIAGCAGGLFDNIMEAASILDGKDIGNDHFSLSVYPGSAPVSLCLSREGALDTLVQAGALIKPAFCGPCFGAGDIPSNGSLSLRHTTRNFKNREGAKPTDSQASFVALADARSIAATARNKGILSAASELEYTKPDSNYTYEDNMYKKRVYYGFNNPKKDEVLRIGPNIADWPKLYPLTENLLLELTAVIRDAVTTTDELIPSGETSSYRSNPLKLAEFTLSRTCPSYVELSKRVQRDELARRNGNAPNKQVALIKSISSGIKIDNTAFGSAIFANKPGDGSAREQAASCQRVLGTMANICYEYATKRYRSNLINWGIIPFTLDKSESFPFCEGDYLYIDNILGAIKGNRKKITACVFSKNAQSGNITLYLDDLTSGEREILLEGCLINHYARSK